MLRVVTVLFAIILQPLTAAVDIDNAGLNNSSDGLGKEEITIVRDEHLDSSVVPDSNNDDDYARVGTPKFQETAKFMPGGNVQYIAVTPRQGYLVSHGGKLKCITSDEAVKKWEKKVQSEREGKHLRLPPSDSQHNYPPCSLKGQQSESVITAEETEVVVGGGDDNMDQGNKKKSTGWQVMTVVLLVLLGFTITYICIKFFSKDQEVLTLTQKLGSYTSSYGTSLRSEEHHLHQVLSPSSSSSRISGVWRDLNYSNNNGSHQRVASKLFENLENSKTRGTSTLKKTILTSEFGKKLLKNCRSRNGDLEPAECKCELCTLSLIGMKTNMFDSSSGEITPTNSVSDIFGGSRRLDREKDDILALKALQIASSGQAQSIERKLMFEVDKAEHDDSKNPKADKRLQLYKSLLQKVKHVRNTIDPKGLRGMPVPNNVEFSETQQMNNDHDGHVNVNNNTNINNNISDWTYSYLSVPPKPQQSRQELPQPIRVGDTHHNNFDTDTLHSGLTKRMDWLEKELLKRRYNPDIQFTHAEQEDLEMMSEMMSKY